MSHRNRGETPYRQSRGNLQQDLRAASTSRLRGLKPGAGSFERELASSGRFVRSFFAERLHTVTSSTSSGGTPRRPTKRAPPDGAGSRVRARAGQWREAGGDR